MTVITESILLDNGFTRKKHGGNWFIEKKTVVNEKKSYATRMSIHGVYPGRGVFLSCYGFIFGREKSGEPKYDFMWVDSLEELMDYWLYIIGIGKRPKGYNKE